MSATRTGKKWIRYLLISGAVVVLVSGAVLGGRALLQHSGHPISTQALRGGAGQQTSPAPSMPAPCTDPSSLTITPRAAEATMGNVYDIWTVSNSGPACSLEGYPVISEHASAGQIAPPINISDDTTMTPHPVAIESGLVSSLYVDYERCSTTAVPTGSSKQVPAPNTIPSAIDVTFAGLTGPISVPFPAILLNCAVDYVRVSPIVQGTVEIPGFTSGGSPPTITPYPYPFLKKSPGASP